MNYLLFAVSILSLSQSANLIRYAQAPALAVGAWRLLGAAVAMAVILLLTNRKSARQMSAVFRSPIVWISGTFFFLHLWSYFWAVQNTTIAAAMILFATNPLMTALWSKVLVQDTPHPRLGIAWAVGFLGLILLLWEQWNSAHMNFLGNLSALVSAIFHSGYILTGKMGRKKFTNTTLTTGLYAVTALWFFVVALARGVPLTDYPSYTWWTIAALIVFPTLMGHTIFNYLLKFLNINWMSCGKLLEPAIAAFVAFFLFGEAVSTTTVAAFILTGIAVAILYSPWERKVATSDEVAKTS